MKIDIQTLSYSAYVAFVFSVLFLGSLAFRQILDELAVQRLGMGEDREAYLDPLASMVVLAAFLLTMGIAAMVFCLAEPSIYIYALPLILGAQVLQMALRVRFQRSQVKTRGLVLRSVLFERVRSVAFDVIGDVEFRYHRIWIDVALATPDERLRFRIFRASAPALARLFRTSCGLTVRHVDAQGIRITIDTRTDL